MEKESLHAGHRKRLKQAMLASDFSGMSEINLLEALLFYSIARGDTNETAHRLLQTFGSVEGVFEADYEDLLHVEGIGEHSAFLIKLVNKTAKTVNVSEKKKAIYVCTNQVAADLFRPHFVGEKDEVMLAMFLDNAGRLIRVDELGKGVVNAVTIDNRKLLEGAIRTNAATVILAHNHPHGLTNPSPSDLRLTQNIRELLRTIGVNLFDHMINADGYWFSMREMPDANKYLTKMDSPKK